METLQPPVLGKELVRPEMYDFRRAARFHVRIGFFILRPALMSLFDKFGREITDLRISVTDRCNFRCVYCRSADPENYREHDEILSWAELQRLAKIFVRPRNPQGAPDGRRTAGARRPGKLYRVHERALASTIYP